MNYSFKKYILIVLGLILSVAGYGQVRIGDPVFTEDFGTVPDDWKSFGKDYQDGKNMYSYRGELKNDKCTRIDYEFAKRSYKIIGITAYRNSSMYDLYGGNGRYCLGSNGEILGSDGAAIKTWHVKIDHTNPDQSNGLAFIANAATSENSFVFQNSINNRNTLTNEDLKSGRVYQFKVFIGNAVKSGQAGANPNVEVVLESGTIKTSGKTKEIEKGATVAWIEHTLYTEKGTSDLTYSFYSVKSDALGNVFIIDDISLCPVDVRADVVNVDLCSEPGKVWFDAVVDDIPEGLDVYTRLMRKAKSGGTWEWDDQTGITDSLRTYTTEDNYTHYDYRLVVSLTASGLERVPDESVRLNEYGTFSVTENFVPGHNCEAWSNFEIGVDFCSQPDSVVFNTAADAFPVTSEVYFRLMRKLKTGGEWEWAGEVSADHRVAALATDYLNYDFQVAVEVASPDILTGSATPRQLMERPNYGCFIIKNTFRNDFCLQLYGVTPDYVTVQDSVSVEPSLVVSVENTPVYLRWLYRPFGSEEWHWWGESRPVNQNEIDWVTFTTGDFRAVYAMSPDVLNAMPDQNIGTVDYYYVATEENQIPGIPLTVNITKRFAGGAVILDVEPTMNSAVTSIIRGEWLTRKRGSELWEVLPAQNGFRQQIGMVNYVEYEYCFVASMSQAVMDTLQPVNVQPGEITYWLSETIGNETFTLEDISREYCEVPGEVVYQVGFASEGIPEDMPAIGRWMQREKGTDNWNWVKNPFPSRIENLQVTLADEVAHDYAFVLAWDHDSLAGWNAASLPVMKDYYVLRSEYVDSALCIGIDTIQIVSEKRDELILQPVLENIGGHTVYGRWMRIDKLTGVRVWASESMIAGYDLKVGTDEFGQNDYRFYIGLAEAVVAKAAADMEEARPYFDVKNVKGVRIPKPEVTVTAINCVAKQDVNRVTLQVAADGTIPSLRYRIGEGAVQEMTVGAENELTFTIERDSAFYLLDYVLNGVCERMVRNDTVNLSYIPKLQIARLTDLFGCRNSVVVVAPEISGGAVSVYEWSKDGEIRTDWADKDSLHIRMTGTGAVPLKLVVKGNGVCPEDSTVSLITGEHPVIDCDCPVEPVEICVGETFTIPYRSIDAEQYRVTLKETTMPGFVFYPGTGDVKENGVLEIKSGQQVLTATDFMAGSVFTFRVQIFKMVEYNEVSYRCEDEFEYRFKVRMNPVSRYPSELKLCMGERLRQVPEVDLNGNESDNWRWRLWDGATLTETSLKTMQTPEVIDTVVTAAMGGKRLQLLATTVCGEVTVQDIRLAVYVPDSNRIVAPEGLVITGDKVVLEGTTLLLQGMNYQWEMSEDGSHWIDLPGETESNMTLYAPDTSTYYRRILSGAGWACPNMETIVKVEVYNNAAENRIYLEAADTLIYSGTEITVHTDSPERKGVGYCWEKNEGGEWIVMTGEEKRELQVTPGTITMYRRGALVDNRVLYSNTVVVNVYDKGQNRIMYAGSLVPRNTPIRLTGNFVDIPGVKYRWYSRQKEEWILMAGKEGWNLETMLDERTTYMRYVYLPSQAGDSIGSNEVTVYVFDNDKDNRIASELSNVCRDVIVPVKGTPIGDGGVAYRWECSYDEENSWMVTDSTGCNVLWPATENVALRRRILYAAADENCYSNVVHLNVIYNGTDNRISQVGTIIAGEAGIIEGTSVENAAYRWEISKDGKTDWMVLANAASAFLQLEGIHTESICWLRRKLLFPDGGGCEEYSNVLKVKVVDPEKSNRVVLAGDYYCQWSPFTLEGSDMQELDATYRWYKNTGKNWEPVEQAYGKDLTVYEGVGMNTLFRRDATVDGVVYAGNVVEARLWNAAMVRNVLENPGEVCAGIPVVIRGSDAYAGDRDLSDYVDSYYWEASQTGAGGTWERIDTANMQDLTLNDPEVSRWYCRIVKTHCGSNLRSEPVFMTVKDRLKLTLRSDVKFGQMSVKDPITISVDEDFYDNYEFRINGRLWESDGQQCIVYGWQPNKMYGVSIRVQKDGCVQVDSLNVYAPDVDLPNVLTPNNDGWNDRLLEGYELKVYNRWGNLLYSGKEGWDGRYKNQLVTAGTYFYVVRVRFENGRSAEYKRSVTVKR